MVFKYLKDYCDILLGQYAEKVLGRPIKDYEKDIFYLHYEFYINKIINEAKDQISEQISKYILSVKEKES